MKKLIKQALMPLLIALCLSSVCCADTEQETALSPGIYLNDHIIEFTTDGNTELDLLSVENGINIQVVKEDDEQITING